MAIDRALVFSILLSGDTGGQRRARAWRRPVPVRASMSVATTADAAILSGQTIVWADGTRSNLTSPHPERHHRQQALGHRGTGRVRPATARAWCGWTIRARRTRRVARCSTVSLTATSWLRSIVPGSARISPEHVSDGSMIAQAAVDRAQWPRRRRVGQQRLRPALVALGLLQGVDEIGEPSLDRAGTKLVHHRFPTQAPFHQRASKPRWRWFAPCRRCRWD